MRRLWRSPTLGSIAVMGTAGLGFAAANLILARILPTEEYALFTLVVALVNIGFALAPAGLDAIVNRLHLEAGPRLLRQTIRTATLVGLGFALVGLAGYGTTPGLALIVLLSVVAGGALMVAGGQFQSEQRFGISLALIQSPNLMLLLAALVTLLAGGRRAALPLVASMAGYAACAAWGWSVLFRERHAKPHRTAEVPWLEALSIAGLNAAALVLIQLERLVIPHVLPLADLATYGVLAAIVGSLFRVLQMGVGYSLLPRLRAAPDVLARRRLIGQELKLSLAIVLLGSAALWALTPLVEHWFLAGKYHLSTALIVAALVSGLAKVLNAFTRSTVAALADARELSLMNLLGWGAAVTAVAAAVLGARWGLAGVIYGVALGWLLRAAVGAYLTARHLRLPTAATATVS